MNGLKERPPIVQRGESGVHTLTTPWLDDQLHTLSLFRKLAREHGSTLLRLRGTDIDYASAELINNAGTQIDEAIIDGRRSWVPRLYEKRAILSGLLPQFSYKLGEELLKDVVNKEIHRFLVSWGEGITQDYPFIPY